MILENIINELPEDIKDEIIILTEKDNTKKLLEIAKKYRENGFLINSARVEQIAKDPEWKKDYKRFLDISTFAVASYLFFDGTRLNKIRDPEDIDYFNKESEMVYITFTNNEKKFFKYVVNNLMIIKNLDENNPTFNKFEIIPENIFDEILDKNAQKFGFPEYRRIEEHYLNPEEIQQEHSKKWKKIIRQGIENTKTITGMFYDAVENFKRDPKYKSDDLHEILINTRKISRKIIFNELQGNEGLNRFFEQNKNYVFKAYTEKEVSLKKLVVPFLQENIRNVSIFYNKNPDEILDIKTAEKLREIQEKYKNLYEMVKNQDNL